MLNTPIFIRGVQLAFRAATGAGLALGLAQYLELQYPIYAMIAAVIVTDLSPVQTRQLGLTRLFATVVGAILGALLSPIVHANPAGIALGILAAMLVCTLLRIQDGAKVAGYICALVLIAHGADSWHYAWYRSLETVLGIFVASAISLIPKLIAADESGTQHRSQTGKPRKANRNRRPRRR